MIWNKYFLWLCPALGAFFTLGFGGSSSSASSTTNIDKRMTVGNAAQGLSGDNSSLTVTDGGIVSRALDTIDIANATNHDSLGKLLDASADLFNRGEGLIGQTQKAVADAYGQAQTTKAGTIDNKTMMMLAAIAGTVAIFARKKA